MALAALALGVAVAVVVAGELAPRRGAGGALPPAAVAPSALRPPDETPAVRTPATAVAGPDLFELRFRRPPRAGLVFDLADGRVLWRRQPLTPMPIASLTKIMTALLVAERTSSRERVKVTRAALAYSGSGVGVLPRGRRVPVEGLLAGLLLVSGNDAAIALAGHVAGDERGFVRLMNRRARELRLACTRFVSPHGLERGNRSCAADLAALARRALRQPRIARVARLREAAVPFPIRGGRLYLNSTNPLLRLRYPGTIGLKTGYTADAGRSYVAIVRRGRRTLGVVLLRSPDPAGQARRLFAKAFRVR